MQSIRLPYKADVFGHPVYARVYWSAQTQAPKPIALIYHGGGLMVGNSDIIPQSQINYLCSKGFVAVIPNYRLIPQVMGKESFSDCVLAYDWATSYLPKLLETEHGITLLPSRVVAMGHSSGGTLSMHIASCRPLKAVTTFYPSLYNSDRTTSMHKPTSVPPFGLMPEWTPTDEERAAIKPKGVQVSEFPLGKPGTPPQPRNKWQMLVLKHGTWASEAQPDGDLASIDPMTRISRSWPPVMIVQGEADNVPGSDLGLAQRAEQDMIAAGVLEVRLEVVPGEGHMFDLPPSVGTTDVGPKWQAVVKGLDWLLSHAATSEPASG